MDPKSPSLTPLQPSTSPSPAPLQPTMSPSLTLLYNLLQLSLLFRKSKQCLTSRSRSDETHHVALCASCCRRDHFAKPLFILRSRSNTKHKWGRNSLGWRRNILEKEMTLWRERKSWSTREHAVSGGVRWLMVAAHVGFSFEWWCVVACFSF